jgi:hypothetical protein
MARLGTAATGIEVDVRWYKHVRECKVGQYLVSAPADASSNHLLVTQDGRFIAVIDPSQFMVFEGHDRLVVGLFDKDHDGKYDWLDYRGRSKESGEDVTAVDTDFDGKTDILSFRDLDGTSKMLFQIEGMWLEHVKQGDHIGFMVGGEFAPTREKAAELVRKSREH